MLGTNDIKPGFARNAKDIADGIDTLVHMILDPKTFEGYPLPAVLVVSPIEVRESIVSSCYSDGFGLLKAVAMAKDLPPLVEAVAKKNGCHFIDAARNTQRRPTWMRYTLMKGDTRNWLAHSPIACGRFLNKQRIFLF